jgi:hypothetical protein
MMAILDLYVAKHNLQKASAALTQQVAYSTTAGEGASEDTENALSS